MELKQMKKPGLWCLHLDLEQLRETCQRGSQQLSAGAAGFAPLPSTAGAGRWAASRRFQASCSVHHVDNSCFPSSRVSFSSLTPFLHCLSPSPFSFLCHFFTLCSKL